jgi:predicted nucleic acid-binding protein
MLRGSLPEVFLDTDVAFDILSKREPHYETSVKLLEMAVSDSVRLVISESSLANLFYLLFDIYKIKDAGQKLSDFIGVCDVVHANKAVILSALRSPFKDKEDSFQYFTALHAKVDYFITRNLKDYKNSEPTLPVHSPEQFVRLTE